MTLALTQLLLVVLSVAAWLISCLVPPPHRKDGDQEHGNADSEYGTRRQGGNRQDR